MLSRLGAHHYRCFRNLDIALPACAVLTGANGTGKSTLQDIPIYLGDMVSHGVQKATLGVLRTGMRPRAQSLREMIHRGLGDELSLLVEAVLPPSLAAGLSMIAHKVRMPPPTRLRYELRLRLRSDTEVVVDAEHLDLVPLQSPEEPPVRPERPEAIGWRTIIDRAPNKPTRMQAEYRRGVLPTAELSPDQLGLSLAVDASLFPGAQWLKGVLMSGATYLPDAGALRSARPPTAKDTDLRSDAANLPWQVLHLQQTNTERFAEWRGMVQLALPNLRDLQAIKREEDHHAYLKLTYDYGTESPYTVTSSGLSDGTLRILALTLVPYLDQLPPLLVVEQPEDGIHPRAIDVVMESLSGLPATQVLVTTHSPVVLSRTPLEQVICLRRDESGAAEAVRGPEHPRLQAWRQELDLGTLFAAGVLS